MWRFSILFSIIICVSSCKIERTYITSCGNYFGEGKLRSASYQACDSTTKTYDFKIGYWEYFDKQGNLVVRNKFTPKEHKVTIRDTCTYDMYMSPLDKKHWKFWGLLEEDTIAQNGFMVEMTFCKPVKINVP